MNVPGTVLVVDDNAALVDNLKEILADAGHAVRIARDVSSAVEAARGGIDVALIDLKLPDGDGSALIPRIKELAPDSEAILLTGFATIESAAASVRAGAWAYLLKPCETGELLRTVDQALRQVQLKVEKRELGRRAQVAEKLAAVGTMTAGLSHEIRNPLNAASLQLQVLERRVRKLAAADQEPLLEPLTLVRDEIRRLDHVLEDFLQFARPASLQPKPVDMGALLEKVVAFLGGDAERRGVKLLLSRNDTPRVAGDEGRLRQVFMNLTLNALDATPKGGSVLIGCESAGEWVRAWVEDTGSGIPPGAMERIFEPFFTTKASGSGLGLPIVHAIVTQHGGTIRAENLPAGGARFVLLLPRSA